MLGQFADLRGEGEGLGKKEGGVFEGGGGGGWYPNEHYGSSLGKVQLYQVSSL